MRYRKILAAMGFGAIACGAQAQSSVVIAITDPLETTRIVNGPVVATASLVLTDASASGYANLDTGVLRSASVGPPIQFGLGYPDGQFSTQSAAQIVDTISFGAAATGTGYLDWHIDGTLSAYGNPFPSATTSLVLNIGNAGGNTGQTSYFTDNPNLCRASPTCTIGTGFDQSGSFAFQIQPGAFSVSVFLQTVAFDGASNDFSNTGRFYLRLPDGVTYTSRSGVFLTDAAPIFPVVSAVPEPSTYLLLLFGLGLASWTKSRTGRGRRSASVEATL